MTKQQAAGSGNGSASIADTHASDQHQDDADINAKPVEVADTDASKNALSGEAAGDATGGQVSEAGGASLNEETNAGGADAVPDTHG